MGKVTGLYKCTYCGKEIYKAKKYKRNGEVADNIFCDRDCYDKYRRMNKEKICKCCGKHFIGVGAKLNAIYCSMECRKKDFAQRTYKFCVICGQGFYPFDYKKSRNMIICDKNIVTCSENCKKIWLQKQELLRRDKISIAFTGKKHPNWQGGRNRYRGENWSRQKFLAKKRDCYRCQKCGITQKQAIKIYGSGLEVHHIKPYRYFNNDYIQANNLNNLVTLCKSFHQLTELETRKNNTKTID